MLRMQRFMLDYTITLLRYACARCGSHKEPSRLTNGTNQRMAETMKWRMGVTAVVFVAATSPGASPAMAATVAPAPAGVVALTSVGSNGAQSLSLGSPTGHRSAVQWKRLRSAATGEYVAVITRTGRIFKNHERLRQEQMVGSCWPATGF